MFWMKSSSMAGALPSRVLVIQSLPLAHPVSFPVAGGVVREPARCRLTSSRVGSGGAPVIAFAKRLMVPVSNDTLIRNQPPKSARLLPAS